MSPLEEKIVKDLVTGPVKSVLNAIGLKIKQTMSNRLIEYQAEMAYRALFVKTILHSDKPIKLTDIYFPITIRYENENNIRIPINSVDVLFERSQYNSLIGSAGCGKSMLMKFLFLDVFKHHNYIPIFLELRYLNNYEGNIDKYLKEKIFEYHNLGFSNSIIEGLFDSGKFVFFLDGYDEIGSKVKPIANQNINNFIQRYSNNRYIIASRPYSNIDSFPLFHNNYVNDISIDEIPRFLEKVVPPENNEIIAKLIEAINLRENVIYHSFLRNPLLLMMFYISFDSYSVVPRRRSDFYRNVFDTLFQKHDSRSKLGFVREKESGLSKDKFEIILESYCAFTFFEEKIEFNRDYVYRKFNIIKNNKELKFENDLVVNDLLGAIGILAEEGTTLFFPHRSVQEYFSARYIVGLGAINKYEIYRKIVNLLIKYPDTDYFNFIHILYEIDQINVLSEFFIPLLTHLQDRLRGKENNTSEVKNSENEVKIIALDFFMISILFKGEKSFEELENSRNDILNDIYKKQDLLSSQKISVKQYDEYFNNVALERIHQFVGRLSTAIDEQLERLKDLGARLDLGDLEIIRSIDFNE